MLRGKKKYPREHVEEKKPDLDLEKKLANLRMIRKSRLDRYEMEYKQQLDAVTEAETAHQESIREISEAKENAARTKADMQNRMIGSKTDIGSLNAWLRSEDKLSEKIQQAEENEKNKAEILEKCKLSSDEAYKTYRKAMVGIEKLDLLKKELDAENQD